ncbi:dihydrofolate reductase [Pedobacter sp. KBW06]|uniref:dihydrofolate reductase family protein n=1 Tax=Pedobacter sp. KBW06 TaxID=2153359 RepID=UPI000F5A1834|nr:dihydrofolate reductase family protein [Pedobacter sp. KBW06]RQO65919.1 dihydrofolate reductase [Pedobacter sp. KBW06]
MRKLILGLAVTLDGYIEGPNGEYDWCFSDQDYGLNEFFTRIDAMFIGRKSYEMAQKHASDNNGEAIPGMPGMTEYVFSNTLKTVKEGAVLISEDSITQARSIKEQPGKDIWLYGGAELSEALMKAGLVDELWLSVHPILLGSGKALFSKQDSRTKLSLLQSKTYETGLVSLRYRIDKL